VWQEITRLGTQSPPSHRSDENMVAMLRTAVIGNTWARDPISRAATSPTTLHALYTQLEAAIQIENEELAAKRKDAAGYARFMSDGQVDALSNKAPREAANAMNGTHFQRYGRSIRGLSGSPGLNRATGGASFVKQLGYTRADKGVCTDSGCFNCGQPGHRAYSSQCPKDVDNIRINANRVKWLEAKYGAKQGVARVLHAISVAQNEFERFIASLPEDCTDTTTEPYSESFINFTRMMSDTLDKQNDDGEYDSSTHFSLLANVERHRKSAKGISISHFSTEN
jgi:Zinc knuckle